MNTIEAKVYLLQAPGVNRVKDSCGSEWEANKNGDIGFNYRGGWKCAEGIMFNYAPFTKVEPEKSNVDWARELEGKWRGTNELRVAFKHLLDAVDDKIENKLKEKVWIK